MSDIEIEVRWNGARVRIPSATPCVPGSKAAHLPQHLAEADKLTADAAATVGVEPIGSAVETEDTAWVRSEEPEGKGEYWKAKIIK